jgi:hypothetical protein
LRSAAEISSGPSSLSPERIIHYIDFYGRDGKCYLSGTKKDWASELGLTHEALSRVGPDEKAGAAYGRREVVCFAARAEGRSDPSCQVRQENRVKAVSLCTAGSTSCM